MRQLPSELESEIVKQMNRTPRSAKPLAPIAHATRELVGSASEIAYADLLLVRSLNQLGEFRRVAARCPDTAQRFLDTGDLSGAASTWLECAWAQTFLGDLDAAEDAIHCAFAPYHPPLAPSREVETKRIWIQARILRDRGDYTTALQHFKDVLDEFRGLEDALNTARLLRELGHTYTLTLPHRAQSYLAEARQIFEQLDCPIDIALCDFWFAQMHRNSNEFMRAQALLEDTRATFLKAKHSFFVAWCDLDLGWVEWGLNHFEHALVLLEKARSYFLEAGAHADASSCEINIAGVLFELYRFEEALPVLQHALDMARASGRRKKAAVCLVSMAWAYDRQGRYAKAIEYYLQAREEFEREQMRERLVTCDLYLGLTYFNLGQYSNALTTFAQVKAISMKANLRAYLAEAEMYHGQVLLVLRQTRAARRAVMHAQDLFRETGQTFYVAFCERLLAQTYHRNKRKARTHLGRGRVVFQAFGQMVERALCDLTLGEMEIAWHEWARAWRDLQNARSLLSDDFPAFSWRVHYGLGKIALARKQKNAARRHHLDAIQTITSLRAGLLLEEWSNAVYHARQQIFADTLKLTQQARAWEETLRVIESGKALLFTNYVGQRDWRHNRNQFRNETSELEQREGELRNALTFLHGQLSVQMAQAQGELLRSEAVVSVGARDVLTQLRNLYQEYESVVARLRLTCRGLAGVPQLMPFSLSAFREMAQVRWGQDWAALSYYLTDGLLTVAYIDAETVEVQSKKLSAYDRVVLEDCTSSHPDLRELIYRGTLRGVPAPSPNTKHLQHLARLLVPPQLRKNSKERTVIVCPHRSLHQLPFHALMEEARYLLEWLTFIYTPSLQALVQLNQNWMPLSQQPRALLCGLSEFDTRARTLEHTGAEIREIGMTLNGVSTSLWQSEATRRTFLELNQSGRLAEFDVLHLATHAVLEPEAPHWSRILLADAELSVLDVLNLDLDARLVTLSACATALGKSGDGDEMIGLVRAFFYAGARAVLATQWAVEDESTKEIMLEFYRNLQKSGSLAGALRGAQLHMLQAGMSPYYWASLSLMGMG